MYSRLIAGFWVAIVCSLGAVNARADGVAGQGKVIVTLPAEATVAGPDVAIGQVCKLEQGSGLLRQRIAALDLAELQSGQSATFDRQLVYYRIWLAGVLPEQFVMRGSDRVAVKCQASTLQADDILAAARKYILARLPESKGEVSLRLLQPIRIPSGLNGQRHEYELLAESRATRLPLGNLVIDVVPVRHGERQPSVTVVLDVRLHQRVPILLKRVERGGHLRADDVVWERRGLTNLDGRYVDSAALLRPQKAKHLLLAGQVLTSNDLEPVNEENPLVVKQNELVQLVAHVGPMEVKTRGEARQNGRLGQLIQVRNIDSRKVVVGRVIGRGLIEVEY